jgi:hypothetical protein
MAQASNESAAGKEAAAVGASALRETAKWLVGGAVATAAGVFAGSTLTNFGQLPLDWRFAVAVGGLLLGFLGIALLINSAMKVMTFDAVSFQELARGVSDSLSAEGGRPRLDPGQLRYMRAEVDRMFKTRPSGLPSYEAVYEAWRSRETDSGVVSFFMEGDQVVTDPARVGARRTAQAGGVSEANVHDLRVFLDAAMHSAQFFKVQYVFTRLRHAMPFYIGLMLLGFGSFAWAANPPDPPARKAAIVVNWP